MRLPEALRAISLSGLVGLPCIVACSGDVNNVSGIVGAIAFKAKTSVAQSVSLGTTPASYELSIEVADYGELCAETEVSVSSIAGGLPIAGTTSLTIVLDRTNSPIQPGTYSVASASAGSPLTGPSTPAPGTVTVSTLLTRFDSNCNQTENEAASSGTISIQGIESDAASGTLHLTFPDGSLSGSFHAAPCTESSSTGTLIPSGDGGLCLAASPPDAG